MINSTTLAPHETLELHELLSSSIIGVKKAKASLSMIQDNELKNFMKSSLDYKKQKIQQLQDAIKQNMQ